MSQALDELIAALAHLDVVDLSPPLERGMPRWPTHPHVVIDPTVTHEHDGYFSQTLNIPEHAGCHVDAPAHTVPTRMEATIDTIPVDYLIAPAVLYDFSDRGLAAGETLSAEDFLAYEERTGARVEEGEIALINYGWYQRYWRTDQGAWFFAKNSPGLDESAVRLLADRNVRAVGADTLSTESPIIDGNVPYQIGHRELWLPKDILIIECLANLEKLPLRSLFMALPLNIKNGSGSPIRAVAFVPRA